MSTQRTSGEVCDGMDNDSDGHCSDVDCNDDDSLVYPGAPELCDQVDNDCDDQTDEDLFAVMPPQAWTIRVGGGPSQARFQLAGPAEVRRLLESLAEP